MQIVAVLVLMLSLLLLLLLSVVVVCQARSAEGGPPTLFSRWLQPS